MHAQVIGALALIDSGETDYKILVVSSSSPFFSAINSPDDLEILRPGFVDSLKYWFRFYKVDTKGGPQRENTFGYGGALLGAPHAWAIIKEAHESYLHLRDGKRKAKGIWIPPNQ